MDWYRGKRVFIAGGSAGIGLGLAKDLAALGADVFIAARGRARLDAALKQVREIASTSQRTGAVTLDVTDRPSVHDAARKAIEGLGGLDVLIANSGYAHTGWVHEMPDSVFEDMIQVNYLGHVNVVRAFLPHMMKQKSGNICLVSSMLGFFGAFGYSAYSASKYAVRGFAESLRHELLPHGIKVTLSYPPTTETPGLEKENQIKPKAVWSYESESGFNKIYTAEQVAQSMLKAIAQGKFEHLCGLDSKFMRLLFRHFPGLSRWINDGELRKAFKRVEGSKELPAGR